ncbi:SDR family oxidoreductase [Sphingopyxis sp. YF1]|uniref:SDR family NAD(P)-dependent oxidoreductase n=1 Tax=Sphingopyxis sp. YF1 TaxID=2482763 RepID=UPI001F60B7EE|nr:SDR family oxidoreductase [Sphingopyxis sp. YF1]UNU43734.1 SDR family oxidoreductase [Sphingopyxis sp. YF1]
MTLTLEPGFCAIVTGASSGIGKAIADRFLIAGALVIGADLNIDDGAVPSERFRPVRMDVSDEGAWRNIVDEAASLHGRLDAVVNVAGILSSGSIEEMAPDQLMRMLDVNTKSVFVACQEAIRAMKKHPGDKSIINIASANAVKAQSWTSGYAASKAAVLSLTRTTALHCAEQGYDIRVNAILPGIVRTPMVETLLAQASDPKAALADLERFHPTGRLLEPNEIADVALFLASPLARGITGAGIAVDCGMTAG